MLLCVKNCTTPQYASTICGVLTAQNTSSLYGVGARNVLVTEWLILCVCNACALAFTGHAVCFSKQFTRTALLKLVLLFYKIPFQVQPLLAKIDAQKLGFRAFFQSCAFYFTPFLSVNVSICTFLPFYLVPRWQFFVAPKTSFSIQKADFWRCFHQNKVPFYSLL